MAYHLRETEKCNYRDLADLKLPRARKLKSESVDRLYAVEVVEKDEEGGKVKVHYVGYGPEYDEWKDDEEIVEPSVPGWLGIYSTIIMNYKQPGFHCLFFR